MNRRELLSGLVATLAAGGVAVSGEVIEAEPVAGEMVTVGSVDLDKIDELLETWRRRAIASRQCGDRETSEVGRKFCDARFWAYFNCINELRTALGLPGLGES
jgi:hypothetical protein